MANPEFRLCCWVVAKFRAHYPQYHLIRVNNGGKRTGDQRRFDWQMGEVKGASDYFLPVPRGKYLGLWLEAKSDTGRPKPEQIAFMEDMRTQGYMGVIAYGAEMWDILQAYMASDMQAIEWLMDYPKRGERNRERKRRTENTGKL